MDWGLGEGFRIFLINIVEWLKFLKYVLDYFDILNYFMDFFLLVRFLFWILCYD